MKLFGKSMFAFVTYLFITGCVTASTGNVPQKPAAEKNYQSVSGAKLGNASFASDYYGKDVESNVTFLAMLPQSIMWVPRGYDTDEWVRVQASGGAGVAAGGSVGLVIPKNSSCTDTLLEAQPGVSIHLWGTVLEPKSPMVGSVIAVDKCEIGSPPTSAPPGQ